MFVYGFSLLVDVLLDVFGGYFGYLIACVYVFVVSLLGFYLCSLFGLVVQGGCLCLFYDFVACVV